MLVERSESRGTIGHYIRNHWSLYKEPLVTMQVTIGHYAINRWFHTMGINETFSATC